MSRNSISGPSSEPKEARKAYEAGHEKQALKHIEGNIRVLRGQKVILDADLAALYGVDTGALNRAVKRNARRFPSDFVFRLTSEEDKALRCQIGISKSKGGRRYLPHAFTEHGAVMAANVLNTARAVDMSVFVVRAFVKMREQLLSRAEMEARLSQIENVLLAHDESIRELYRQIRPLLLPPPDPPAKPIGFAAREGRTTYTYGTAREKQFTGSESLPDPVAMVREDRSR